MATLEEVKEEIGQLRLEHGNKLTPLRQKLGNFDLNTVPN